MDFSYSEKEEAFRIKLRNWLEINLPTGWLDGKRQLPKDAKEQEIFLREWHKCLYEGGWLGISWPEEYGGQGATLIEQVIYEEEMARVEAPPHLNSIAISNIGPTLIHIGTEEHRRKYINKILSAEEIWCQGYSEPNSGSDLASVQTRAVRNGDQYIINGQKIWTSDAHLAHRCFLLARTANNEKKHYGLTVFLVDMKQPGVEVRPIIDMSGEHVFNEIFFTNAVVGIEDIVGEVDKGWQVAMFLLQFERVGGAKFIFKLQNAFKDLVELTQAIMKGDHSLSRDPIVRQRLADYYSRGLAGLLNYYRNVTKQLQSGMPGAEGSIDKLYSSELLKEVLDYGSGIAGLTGAIKQQWDQKWLSSFGLTIAAGTSEIQKNIIGERMLGLPKDMKK